MPARSDAKDRGAVVVEFAIVLPLLLMVVFGIVEFGIYFDRQQALNASAREGARYAALADTQASEIEGRARNALPAPIRAGAAITVSNAALEDGGRIEYSGSTAPCAVLGSGETVYVEVKSNMVIDIPGWPSSGQTFEQIGRGAFRCE
jgi:Flp pilus assembly protein TadG